MRTETQVRSQDLIARCEKQKKIDRKYRLPTFDCPVCGAKHILFAGDTTAKNETVLVELEKCGTVDYAIQCPKCKKIIGVRRYTGVERAPVFLRAVCVNTVALAEVLNHRLLTEKDETYIAALPVFEGVIDEKAAGAVPPAVVKHYLTMHH